MKVETLESGYWQAYQDFYQWGSILRGAGAHAFWLDRLRHLAYAGGWKKFEPMWDWVIRFQRAGNFRPLLESLLVGSDQKPAINQEVSARPGVHTIGLHETE